MNWRSLLLGAVFATIAICSGMAAELAPELRVLLERFAAHRRVAAAYLRTENLDLAAVEIERMRADLTADRNALPSPLAADLALAAALTGLDELLRESLDAADRGDVEAARSLLERAASPLTQWRRRQGIRLFADCIAETSAAHERLDAHRARAPDLSDAAVRQRIIGEAQAVTAALMRCNDEAAPAVREEPEFRRLCDGMIESLARVPEAVRRRDGGHLYRLLIEQRSFERLLVFRYG